MRGEYIITVSKGGDEDDEEIIVPNTLVGEGQTALMDALFNRNDVASLSFFVGLFSEVPAFGTVNIDPFASEPVGNGYARTAVAAASWTIGTVNEEAYAQSPSAAFTAAGGDFNVTFNRFFLIARKEKPAATFTNYLVSYSSALAAAVQLLDTQTYTVAYRVYMR